MTTRHHTQATPGIQGASTIHALPRSYPKLQARALDPNAYPRHKPVITEFPDEDKPGSIFFHTAGTQVLWAIPTAEVTRNPRIIAGMDPWDAFCLALDYARARDWHQQRKIEALRQARTAEAGRAPA